MYKEYRFANPDKAAKKKEQLEKDYGYKFPVYQIELDNHKWLSIVYPNGLQPNPKKKTQLDF